MSIILRGRLAVKRTHGGPVKRTHVGPLKRTHGGPVKRTHGGPLKRTHGGPVKRTHGGPVKRTHAGPVKLLSAVFCPPCVRFTASLPRKTTKSSSSSPSSSSSSFPIPPLVLLLPPFPPSSLLLLLPLPLLPFKVRRVIACRLLEGEALPREVPNHTYFPAIALVRKGRKGVGTYGVGFGAGFLWPWGVATEISGAWHPSPAVATRSNPMYIIYIYIYSFHIYNILVTS